MSQDYYKKWVQISCFLELLSTYKHVIPKLLLIQLHLLRHWTLSDQEKKLTGAKLVDPWRWFISHPRGFFSSDRRRRKRRYLALSGVNNNCLWYADCCQELLNSAEVKWAWLFIFNLLGRRDRTVLRPVGDTLCLLLPPPRVFQSLLHRSSLCQEKALKKFLLSFNHNLNNSALVASTILITELSV